MLDLQDEDERLRLAEAIRRMTCEIAFPEDWAGFLNAPGPLRSEYQENRQFPRWRNRTLAGLIYRGTFPGLPRPTCCHPVYLKDLSRAGAAFLHFEQLYPLERMQLLLIDETSSRLLREHHVRAVEVQRCRRLKEKCFEVGVRFTTT